MKYFSNLDPKAKLLIAITGAAIFYAFLFFLLVTYSTKKHESAGANSIPYTETIP